MASGLRLTRFPSVPALFLKRIFVKPNLRQPQTLLFAASKCVSVEAQPLFPPWPGAEEARPTTPETEDMNEVETPSAPDETHVWAQPRAVKPTKPRKSPQVTYMSEWPSPAWGGRRVEGL